MSKETSIVVREDITLKFSGSTLTGDIHFRPGSNELLMVNTEGEQEICWYLSTSLGLRHYVPRKRHVLISDADRDAGLTATLVAAEVVRVRKSFSLDYGFDKPTIYEVKVLCRRRKNFTIPAWLRSRAKHTRPPGDHHQAELEAI